MLDTQRSGSDRSMQRTATMAATNIVRKIIRGCVDDARTLRHESKLVDPVRSEALRRLARERDQFVADLERLAQCKEPHDGSWIELSRELERNIWVAAAGRNNGDAIASCRHSRARTEALYEAVLQASLPDEIHCVLLAQRRRLHDEADELIHLQF